MQVGTTSLFGLGNIVQTKFATPIDTLGFPRTVKDHYVAPNTARVESPKTTSANKSTLLPDLLASLIRSFSRVQIAKASHPLF